MKLNNFLEEIKSEKYLIIFIGVFLILVYCIYKNMSFCKKNIENMVILDDKQIIESVNKFYSSDDFIRSITTIFQKIQANGLQIEGNIDLTGNVKADGEISNQNISLTNFSKKIDDKIKLLADREAAAKERRRLEAERERLRIEALGKCGMPKLVNLSCPGVSPADNATVRCPRNDMFVTFSSDCQARREGCYNCPRIR